MVTPRRRRTRSRIAVPFWLASALTVAGATTALVGVIGVPSAAAAMAPVSLGSSAGFTVLAGSTVTNTGATTVTGDLGLSPGTAVTGFPPGQLTGATHIADDAAVQAKSDLVAAYNDAAARPTTNTVPVELGGTIKAPGVYASPAGTFGITGTVTLDGQGDPNAVFIFKAASTLITASASGVSLINGARACNVFWQVGSSATLGTYSIIRGNVLAMASITVTTGVTVDGRALAREAAVTLDTDTITRPTCELPAGPSTTSLATSANPGTAGQPVTFTATVAAGAGPAIPSGLVVFVDRWDLIGVVILDVNGRATLSITPTTGLHLVRAVYLGANGFLSSRSALLYELVQ
jgi:hypothetical protein